MLSSYILYIIFKICEWHWKNSHRSTAHVHLFVSGATQTPNITKSAPSPKSYHQPNQLPTKPIPSRRWLKEPLLGRPHVIQFQDSEAEPSFFPTRNFFQSHFCGVFFWVEHPRMVFVDFCEDDIYLRIADIYIYIHRYGCTPTFSFGCEFFIKERPHHKDLEDWFKNPHKEQWSRFTGAGFQHQQWQCLYINPIWRGQSCAMNFNDGHLRLPHPKCHPGPQP